MQSWQDKLYNNVYKDHLSHLENDGHVLSSENA